MQFRAGEMKCAFLVSGVVCCKTDQCPEIPSILPSTWLLDVVHPRWSDIAGVERSRQSLLCVAEQYGWDLRSDDRWHSFRSGWAEHCLLLLTDIFPRRLGARLLRWSAHLFGGVRRSRGHLFHGEQCGIVRQRSSINVGQCLGRQWTIVPNENRRIESLRVNLCGKERSVELSSSLPCSLVRTVSPNKWWKPSIQLCWKRRCSTPWTSPYRCWHRWWTSINCSHWSPEFREAHWIISSIMSIRSTISSLHRQRTKWVKSLS